MKSFLTKVGALLMTVVFAFAGCQDYDEDIRKVNEQLNTNTAELTTITEELEAAIEALEAKVANDYATKAALEELKAALQAKDTQLSDAIAAIDAAYKAADAALKSGYETADANLQKKIDDASKAATEAIETLTGMFERTVNQLSTRLSEAEQYTTMVYEALNAEIVKLKAADTKLEGDLKTVANNLAAAKTELEAADAAINTRIDGAIANIEKNAQAIEALTTLHKNDVALLQAAIAENTTSIDGVVRRLNDLIDEYTQTVEDLQGAIGENTTAIEAQVMKLNDHIRVYTQTVEDLQGAIGENTTAIDAVRLAVSELARLHAADVEDLQAAIADNTTLAAGIRMQLLDHISTYKTTIEQLENQVTANQGEITMLKVRTLALEVAYEELQTLHAADVIALEAAIAENTTAIEAEIIARTLAINELKALHTTDVNNLEEVINNNERKIGELQLAVKDLQAADEELQNQITTLQKDLEAFKQEAEKIYALKTDVTTTKVQLNELTSKVNKLEAEAIQKISDLNVKVDELAKSLQARIDELATKLNGLGVNVEALMSRIQSVVYVPVNNEGKAPVDYVTVGQTVIETDETTVTYLVKPASAAKDIANAFAAGEDLTLSYVVKNVEYLTKAMDVAKPALNVTKAVADDKGYLFLSVQPSFGQDFYTSERSKGISGALVLENTKYEATEEFTTEYVNFIPGEVTAAYSLGLQYTEPKGKKYNGERIDYTVKYTSAEVINVLDNIIPVFCQKGNPTIALTVSEFEKIYGVAPWVGVKIAFDPEETKVFDTTADDEAFAATVKLHETGVLSNVGQKMSVTFTYNAGKNAEESASAYAQVEVIGELVNYTVNNTLTATWNYKDDAKSDANLEPTFRSFEVDIDSIAVDNILANTQLKDVLASTPEITVNGVAVESGLVLSADTEKMTVKFTGFEWDETYVVKAKYTLPYATVYVDFTVETYDRQRDAITVNYGKTTAMFEKDLVIPAFGENNTFALQAVVDSLVANGNLDAATYTEDIFVNHETAVTNYSKLDAERNVITSAAAAVTTDLRYDFEKMSLSYRYKAESFKTWYQTIIYTSTFTTWYGQEVTVEHTLELELPTYDFAHRSYYVKKDTSDVWYSQVTGKYTPELPTTALTDFEVNNIELDKAFYVVNPNGEEVADYAKFGLVTDFELEGTYGEGISMSDDNVITYNDKDDMVDVLGKLYIKNSNGLMVELPTRFATEYANYYVNKYDPIGELHATDLTVEINNAKVYNIPVLSCFSLKDRRNFVEAYELIDSKTGTWVLGDDENGFAKTYTPDKVYGLNTNFSQVVLPKGYEQIISFKNGVLSFDNTNHMGIVEDINIDIVFVIEYTWGYRQAKVTVTFPKNVQ